MSDSSDLGSLEGYSTGSSVSDSEWGWVCALCSNWAQSTDELVTQEILGENEVLYDTDLKPWVRCGGCKLRFHLPCLYPNITDDQVHAVNIGGSFKCRK